MLGRKKVDWAKKFMYELWEVALGIVRSEESSFKICLPVIAGYIPLGIAFGMYASSQQLPLWWIMASSVFVYSGALQFALVGLIATSAGLTEIAFASAFLSVRHIFFGLSYPLKTIRASLGKAIGVHTLTDETYALTAAMPIEQLTGRRLLQIGLINQAAWGTGSLVGAIFMRWIHFDVSFMGFTLTALFIILAINLYRKNPRWRNLALAICCAGVGTLFGKQNLLPVALTLYTAVVIFQIRRKRQQS